MLVLSRDEPPPNVDDLKVVRLDIPDDENAFFVLKKAAAEICEPENRRENLNRLYGMIGGRVAWDEALVQEFLKTNAHVFPLLDQVLTMDACQVPEFVSFGQNMDYLRDWRDMARIMALGALSELRSGSEALAFERAMDIITLGHLLEDSGGPLIPWLVARAVKEIGLGTVEQLLADTTMEAEALRPFITRLAACETDRDALDNALSAEYQLFSNTIDDLLAGKADNLGIPMEEVKLGYAFKPNQTRRMFAEGIRWGKRNATAPYWKRDLLPPEDIRWMLDEGVTSERPSQWGPNPIGSILLGMILPSQECFVDRACRVDWWVRATRVALALRCYYSDTGELPERLDDLVPQYIEAVPLDPYDGKPLRYSRAERRLCPSKEDLPGQDHSYKIPVWTD